MMHQFHIVNSLCELGRLYTYYLRTHSHSTVHIMTVTSLRCYSSCVSIYQKCQFPFLSCFQPILFSVSISFSISFSAHFGFSIFHKQIMNLGSTVVTFKFFKRQITSLLTVQVNDLSITWSFSKMIDRKIFFLVRRQHQFAEGKQPTA